MNKISSCYDEAYWEKFKKIYAIFEEDFEKFLRNFENASFILWNILMEIPSDFQLNIQITF